MNSDQILPNLIENIEILSEILEVFRKYKYKYGEYKWIPQKNNLVIFLNFLKKKFHNFFSLTNQIERFL